MTRLYHSVRQVLNGMRAINNQIKYMTISFGVALIHFIFTIAFGVYHIMPLFLYNIAITVFYFYHSFVTLKKKQYIRIYISSLIEILFHSTLASVLLGWDWGFMIYTIALVPVAFYLMYTLPYFEGSILWPVLSSVIVIVCYFIVRIFCGRVPPMYHGNYPDNMQISFYYFNTMVTFIMLFTFSILFALEIRFMQRKLEQENHKLGEMARFDPLTHLLNRRSMNTYLRQMAEKNEKDNTPFCVIMADIDDFKVINDTYGHDCGDEVLIAVADVISKSVRAGDYICRWGGEEILILVGAELRIASQVAERICKEVASHITYYNDKEIQVTITMGISGYQKGSSIRSMIEKADQNLYQGKNNGKNQVVI